MIINTDKLCTEAQMLDDVFPLDRRPCKRTVASWRAKRIIPYHKIGNMIYYVIADVREKLAKRNYVRAI